MIEINDLVRFPVTNLPSYRSVDHGSDGSLTIWYRARVNCIENGIAYVTTMDGVRHAISLRSISRVTPPPVKT